MPGPGPGGMPESGPGGMDISGGKMSRGRTESVLGWFRTVLGSVFGGSRAPRGSGTTIPPYSASTSGLARDYLTHAVGLLRFGANVSNFEFQPSVAVIAKDLTRLAESLRDLRVPLEMAIEQVMIPSIRTNFQVGGRPPWEELGANTVEKHRARLGLGPKPILVRSGALMRAATSREIWTVTPVSMSVRDLPADVWYGKLHQGGVQGSTSNWFKAYMVRARTQLGPRATHSQVTKHAWKIFDQRLLSQGPMGMRGQVDLPERRFIVFQEKDITDIMEIFYRWMDVEIIQKGGFMPGGAPI